MTSIANITLSRTAGGDTETITIYTEKIEDINTKAITVIAPGQGTSKKDKEPRDAKVIDIQKFERRFAIRGSVDDADVNTLKAMFRLGGTVSMEFDSNADGSIANTTHFGGEITIKETSIPVILDKLTVTQDAGKEDAHQMVELTGISGDPL